MTEAHSRRRRAVVTVFTAITAVVVLAAAVTTAWLRRTAPPWPAVAGTAYEIPLGRDGCPVIDEQREFVDAPGPLVPPGATEVLLCTIPTAPRNPRPGVTEPPRQRVLRAGAADFAAHLNQLPDRNEAWRRWQRRHSGWWPDAAGLPIGEVCLLGDDGHDGAFVLRYPRTGHRCR